MHSTGKTLEEFEMTDEQGNKKWVYLCSCGEFATTCGHWNVERDTNDAAREVL